MVALLRIPGAFSAQDALEWTKEFVGSTHVLESESEVLNLFGRASLSLPTPELATVIASQWSGSPLVSMIPLVKYTLAALNHDAIANGRSGLAMALFMALIRGFKAEETRSAIGGRPSTKCLALWPAGASACASLPSLS